MKLSLETANHLSTAATPTPGRKTPGESPVLKKACQDFEALFLHAMFKGMRSTSIEGGLLENGKEQEIFQDLLDTEVANAAAAQNTLGIAQSLLRQFEEKKG
ncbi:MAG: hypothetical protein HGA96_09105 [Desulfobulbaceae bacterium]|nr:hypothetical protein [Desulfobulbaceae bacterium]